MENKKKYYSEKLLESILTRKPSNDFFKILLEQQIFELVRDFEKETNLKVTEINLQRLETKHENSLNKITTSVEVK